MKRPKELIRVHADNCSAEGDLVTLSNEACELARWIEVVEARIEKAERMPVTVIDGVSYVPIKDFDRILSGAGGT